MKPAARRRVVERGLVSVLGLLVAFLLLEGGLRLLGWLHHSPLPVFSGSTPSVLCLGDSYTAGAGAPADMSYPAQLARLLEASGAGPSAINAGRLTQNTHQMLEQLPYLLARYRPRIVVLMIGLSNRWNTLGFQETAPQAARAVVSEEVSTGLFSCLRVYRLARLLALDVAEKPVPVPPPAPVPGSREKEEAPSGPTRSESAWWLKAQGMLARQEYDAVIQWMRDFRPPLGEEDQRLFVMGMAYKDKFDFPMALLCLKEAARLNPRDWKPPYHMGRIHAGLQRVPLALECYKKAILLSDRPKSIFADMVGICPVAELPTVVADLAREKPELRAILAPLMDLEKSARAAEDWIRRDLMEAIRICRQENVTLVLMDYPCGLVVMGSRRSHILRQIAQESSLPFVDNAESFARLGNVADYLVPDGHCNARGYGVIARNVYETIGPLLSSPSTGRSPAR